MKAAQPSSVTDPFENAGSSESKKLATATEKSDAANFLKNLENITNKVASQASAVTHFFPKSSQEALLALATLFNLQALMDELGDQKTFWKYCLKKLYAVNSTCGMFTTQDSATPATVQTSSITCK